MSFGVELFDNKIRICAALMLWTFVSCSIFCFIMIKDGSNFLTLGPNAANQLLGVKMDTWQRHLLARTQCPRRSVRAR